jgi:CHAD domain-containing protein
MERIAPSSPAAPAVRATLERVLDDAVEAAARLSDSGDPEALHDVRVSLRRLRVLLRAYQSELRHAVPRWLTEDVSALAARTGAARDLEVFEAWLAPRIGRLPRPHQPTARWLLARTVTRRDASYRSLRRSVPRGIAMIEPLLRAGLRYQSAGTPAAREGRTFGDLTARRARQRMEDLLGALRKIEDAGSDEQAHRARIAAKKVRYILEPVLLDRHGAALSGLKLLQDALGALHDLVGARVQILRARRVKGEAGEPPTPRRLAGLAALLARVDREKIALFRRIRTDWLTGPPRGLAPARRWVSQHTRRAETTAEAGRAGAR